MACTGTDGQSAPVSAVLLSRREFARQCVTAVGGVAGAIAGGPACRSLPPSGSRADGLRRDLAGLGGRLRLDDASRQDAAEDFGHIVHRRPLAVLRPDSADDVVAVVRYANRQRVSVAMNGNSHSVYGQAQARDGIVIQAGGLKRIHAMGGDYADVDAGVTWGELLEATLARGMTPRSWPSFRTCPSAGR